MSLIFDPTRVRWRPYPVILHASDVNPAHRDAIRAMFTEAGVQRQLRLLSLAEVLEFIHVPLF
jgi:hypothetical protein